MKKIFEPNIKRAEKKLGLKFNNKDNLLNALTHKSYLAEKAEGLITNERLEFLGDAVLGLVVTRKIYLMFPDFPEGELAKLRSNIVNSETLAEVGSKIGIGEDIIMGRGTEQADGRKTISILENTLEAIIGAIYMDSGLKVAEKFISKNFDKVIEKKSKLKRYSDAKTALQEKSIEIMGQRPIYQIIKEEGPYHDRVFHSQVKIGDKVYGKGKGKSKKKAEQLAADKAIKKLKAKLKREK